MLPMVEKRTIASRRDAQLDRLGGPPGRYTVLCVVLSVLWFPFRLLLDRGEPIALIIADSGLHGVVWALMALAIEWGQRVRGKTVGPGDNLPSTITAQRRAWARRGAIVGLGVGVPFYSALITLCLITGRSWWYTTSFSLIMLAIVAVALRSRRRSTGASTA